MFGLGMQELLVILAIVMLLFGGKKLPEVGRNLGKAIRGFRQAEDETMKELKKAAEDARADKAAPETNPETETTEAGEEGGDKETERPSG
jgi:sec-independent protein translocase protein TatA